MRTDAELVAAFRDGDDGALAVLYDRYKRALFVYGTRMLGDGDAARDLVQDVFLKVFGNRERMERPERFRSWLFTVARNHCISQMRRNRRATSLEHAPDRAFAVEPEPSRIEAEQDALLVRAALAAIKEEYREVLVLREYERLSYAEIAEITGTTEEGVRSRLFKARRAIHETMKASIAE
jgi:RNA polymerase sigma-70 factor (ECF subfamily)